jgi:hypothetical protein
MGALLTGGRVCRKQLLLVLASAVILGSESRGTRYHIYCLRFELPFSSPPTTLRATVEVFDRASTRETGNCLSLSHIATDGQSVCLSWCRAPSGAHDQVLVTV